MYWLLGKLYRQPVLLDYFLGLTDTNEDRQSAAGLKAALYRWIDRFNIASMVSITDAAAHRDAFRDLLGVTPDKMSILPIGIKDDLFQPLPAQANGDRITVQFVGNFIPFQGVDVILRAAALLKDESGIHFEMIGTGQTYRDSTALADELGLSNVEFLGYIGHPDLLEQMRHSTIQLGVFGDSYKTRYVVPNKVYEGLALGLPMITAESPALDEFFTPGEHLITVPAGNPERLAEAILRLARSPAERERLSAAGARRIQEAFLPEHIGAQLKTVIESLLSQQG
jgi:glycosyltransferase involved in cell wall biosynthesis